MLDSVLTALRHWLATTDIDAVLQTLAVLGLLLVVGARLYRRRSRRSSRVRRHARNVEKARTLFADFRGWHGERVGGRIITYLRKIDPYVFEELVLTALEAQGVDVQRNHSYSGDGGVDGRVTVDGCRYLIQAKRYSGLINAQHLRAFSEAIAGERAEGGFFVHTGRTPPGAYRKLAVDPRINLISGNELVGLMQARPLNLFPDKRSGNSTLPR